MENYLPLVLHTAEKMRLNLPDNVELDDLVSAGIFGLMDAIVAFDLDRGARFETYCTARIRGAILDQLRSMDWVPRLMRSQARRLETVTKQLETELGRTPTGDEIANRLKVSMSTFERMASDAKAVVVSGYRDIEVLQDTNTADPLHEMQIKGLRELIATRLSRVERMVLVLYHFEEMPMKEIARVMGLSESRVSQMHSSILSRLQAGLLDKSATP
jgi:RNA polymerase sigma factor FliA